MCVRHAYRCKDCDLVFAIPLGQSLVVRILDRVIPRSSSSRRQQRQREERVDVVCQNKYCLRKTEIGYKMCLPMRDPCWFCLRYGHNGHCYNKIIYDLCKDCFYRRKRLAETPTQFSLPAVYGLPKHYRRLERLKQDHSFNRYLQLRQPEAEQHEAEEGEKKEKDK